MFQLLRCEAVYIFLNFVASRSQTRGQCVKRPCKVSIHHACGPLAVQLANVFDASIEWISYIFPVAFKHKFQTTRDTQSVAQAPPSGSSDRSDAPSRPSNSVFMLLLFVAMSLMELFFRTHPPGMI